MQAGRAATSDVRIVDASRAKFARTSLLAALFCATSGANICAAETIQQALRAAYRTNPQLDAERARLRATDEEVPRARSGWRPVINGQAEYGSRHSKTKPRSDADGRTTGGTYSLSLSQPLFTGFRTLNAVREAEATVRAGRANLRNVEAQILLEAATAYADVVRDRALVQLNRGNVRVLNSELRAARARRIGGEVTVTDVAQAQARRARAESGLDQAKAELKASSAEFLRVIGHPPRRLRAAGFQRHLTPSSLRATIKIAMDESPLIIAALYREQSARHNVDKLRGELLPSVSLEANVQTTTGVSELVDEQSSASLMGRLVVPLYQGGETRARVRQAKHSHVSRLQEIEQLRDQVRARATAAWSRLRAAKSNLASDREQVRAAQIALEGVREEEQVGQRTILDVLNAEQELLDANTSRARNLRDVVVAQYSVLAAIGRLDASFLQLKTDIYEPKAHYEVAKRKALTTSIAPPQDIVSEDELGFEHAIEKAIVTGSINRDKTPERRPLGHAVSSQKTTRNAGRSAAKPSALTVRRARIPLRGVKHIHSQPIGVRRSAQVQSKLRRTRGKGLGAVIPGLRNSVIEQ